MAVNVFTDRMKPIDAPAKGKRLAWAKAISPIDWAYLKMLRESNKTRCVYEENPFAEVYQFRDNMYGIFIQNPDGAADYWQYLIIGPEKAMLIDAGFGIGDTPALCAKLTDGKPLIVALTHAGPDHCLGSFQFDTVCCYENEVEVLKAKCTPDCFDYMFDENGKGIWLDIKRSDLPAYREFQAIGVENHHVFNLGKDYDVELIWTGGHDGGHAVFLDKKNRIVYTGDIIESGSASLGCDTRSGFANSKYTCLETCRDNLAELCQRFDEFDHIFPGHGVLELENIVLKAMVDTLNEIIADPECYDLVGRPGKRQQYQKYIKDFGGIIRYTLEGVHFNP